MHNIETNDMLTPTQREALLGEVSSALSDAVLICHVNTCSVRLNWAKSTEGLLSNPSVTATKLQGASTGSMEPTLMQREVLNWYLPPK